VSVPDPSRNSIVTVPDSSWKSMVKIPVSSYTLDTLNPEYVTGF
jgi:hypothetical protein